MVVFPLILLLVLFLLNIPVAFCLMVSALFRLPAQTATCAIFGGHSVT